MNRIKLLRQERGDKQNELADALQVSQSTLSKWERGDFEPDREALFRIADRYKVSLDYLMGYSVNREHTTEASLLLKEYLANTFGRKFTDDDVRSIEKIIGDIEDYRKM